MLDKRSTAIRSSEVSNGVGRDAGYALLRATVGLLMAAHGAQKLFGWFGGSGISATGAGFAKLGYSPGRFFACVAGLTEFGAGLMFAVGVLMPFACAGVIGVMTNVVFAVEWDKGLFAKPGSGQGYEFPLLLGIAAVSFAFVGPGNWSLDGLIGLDRRWARLGSGLLCGVGAVVLGVGVASVVILGFKN